MNSSLLTQFENENLYFKLRGLLLDKKQEIRIVTLRLLRYTTHTPKALNYLQSYQIPLLVTHCLEHETKPAFFIERFQGLKFIAHWINIAPAPIIFFRALVAIANQVPDDQLKKSAVEILRRAAVSQIDYCTWSGGLSVIIKSVIDPDCEELSECIVLTLLFLINDPKTRCYFHEYKDLGPIWAVFTESCTTKKEIEIEKKAKLEAKLKLAKRALLLIMKNWNGLVFLTSDPNGLQSLVYTLKQPIRPIVKKALFDVFFDIFSVAHNEAKHEKPIDNIIYCYMSMVIQAFTQCKIFDILFSIISEPENEFSLLAQRLLKQIMQLSDRIFPGNPKTLPLIELATNPNHLDPSLKSTATKAIRELRACCKPSIIPEVRKIMSETFLKSIEFTSIKGGPCHERLKDIWGPLKMELTYDLELSQLNALIKKSNLSNSENGEWDWNILLELFENGLQNPIKLKSVFNMKFIKSLLNFFKPGKGKFIEKEWNKENFIYAKVGYYMIKSLLKTKKGRERLAVPKKSGLFSKKVFLSYYIDCLDIEEAHTKAIKQGMKSPDNESYFKRERIMTTMAREYFSWLGLFTHTQDCINLLEGLEIFTYLRKLANVNGLEDHLCIIIINSFDYTFDAPRNLIQFWIERGSINLVLYIIEHLRILYRNSLESIVQWCIDILITQIYAENEVVARKALSVIEEICEVKPLIQTILNKWPQIDKLQLGGDLFLAKFLRIDKGIKYFQEFNWIDGAIERWMEQGNTKYVEQAEMAIYKEINASNINNKDNGLQFYVPIDCPLDVRDDVIHFFITRCRSYIDFL